MKLKFKYRFINIVGIDGSGKTSLALNLTHHLNRKGTAIQYRYCQYFAKLLYPFKILAKFSVMRKTDEFRDYKAYNNQKKLTSSRFPVLAAMYAFIWFFDYLIQVTFKITLPAIFGKRFIVDRYIFDIAVNLSLTTNRSVTFAEKILKWFFRFVPKPDKVIFIDIPEETAFLRKDDIQDIEYLAERRERYLYIAEKFSFDIVDGTRNPHNLLKDVIKILERQSKSEDISEIDKDNRKTILYVHANNTDIGGADYCLFKLASELDKTLFRPVVCLAKDTSITELYRNEGIKTRILKMERIKKSLNPIYLFKLAVNFFPTVGRIRAIIREENVDLVHGNDLLDIYGSVAGILEKKPTTQYIRWILESPSFLKTIITALVYRLNNRILTVSEAVSKHMFSKKGHIRQGVVTCHDWIDMEKVGHHQNESNIRKEYQIDSNSVVIGCVGRLEHWKGQDVFIRAAAIVLAAIPNAVFMVVGGDVEGRGREAYGLRLRELAKRLKIEDRIIFTGHRSDIAGVMCSFDIFVHSSIAPDPLPGVVLEAMYCGRPVVGADAGGVPEEVANEETGLLYEPGNYIQMAEQITWLINNPSLAFQMGEAGYQRVCEVFAKAPLCEKIQTEYESMICEYSNQNGILSAYNHGNESFLAN